MDNRIKYILSHKNALLGDKSWSELDSVIYAFVPTSSMNLLLIRMRSFEPQVGTSDDSGLAVTC